MSVYSIHADRPTNCIVAKARSVPGSVAGSDNLWKHCRLCSLFRTLVILPSITICVDTGGQSDKAEREGPYRVGKDTVTSVTLIIATH